MTIISNMTPLELGITDPRLRSRSTAAPSKMEAAQMLQRSARVVGLERSDRRSQESQLLASAGLGAKSTRRQLTAQEASRTRARIRFIRVPTEPITEPEDDDFDEDSAGAAGDLGHGLGDAGGDPCPQRLCN